MEAVQDTQEEIERFSRDADYYEAHWKQLLEQYPERWVAVFDEQVVGADPDPDRLLASLREQGVPAEEAFIWFVTGKDEMLILPS